jgi:hypothetical protein
MFTPKFGRKNVGTPGFQVCIIKESTRCKLVTANSGTVSESAILWLKSASNVSRLYFGQYQKRHVGLYKEEKIRVQVI